MSACQNIIIGAAKKVLIAPVGEIKANAVNLGATVGGVTVAIASEKSDIYVDQYIIALRGVINQRTFTATIPLAEVTLDNLKLAFGGSVVSGVLTLNAETEKYYQLWIESDGPIDDTLGSPKIREYYFKRVALSGNASLVMNRTDAQNITLEATVYACPNSSGVIEIGTITDTVPEEE